MSAFPTGWFRDDAAVEAATVAISAMQSTSCVFGDHVEFRGYAQRQIQQGRFGHFPHIAEKKLFGQFLPAFFQRRGTCVGQGTGRAVQDAWLSALVQRDEVGVAAEVALEVIYAGARIQIGGGRVGSGDGAVGAWAAQFVAKYGLVRRGVYGRYDLSKPAENYAVEWGAPGRGVPDDVLKLGASVKVRCYRCMSGDEVMDAAYTPGVALAMCGGYTFGPKDANGMSRLSQPANHCTELVGGFVTTGGNPGVLGQQSWGAGNPKGTSTLQYKGGSIEMREGMCGVPLEDVVKVGLQNAGEIWAFQIDHGKGFREQ